MTTATKRATKRATAEAYRTGGGTQVLSVGDLLIEAVAEAVIKDSTPRGLHKHDVFAGKLYTIGIQQSDGSIDFRAVLRGPDSSLDEAKDSVARSAASLGTTWFDDSVTKARVNGQDLPIHLICFRGGLVYMQPFTVDQEWLQAVRAEQ